MHDRIETLMLKALDGATTVAERVELERFLDANPAERQLFAAMLADSKALRADAAAVPEAPPVLHGAVMTGIAGARLLPSTVNMRRALFVLACGMTLAVSATLGLLRLINFAGWQGQIQVIVSTGIALVEGAGQVLTTIGAIFANILRMASRQPLAYAAMAASAAALAVWTGALRRMTRATVA